MTDSGRPMLADFGHSRASIYSGVDLNTSTYMRRKETCNWMAYELAEFVENPIEEAIYSKASDV